MRYQPVLRAETDEPQEPEEETNHQQLSHLRLEPARRRVTLGHVAVRLTTSEFDLLATLLSRPGEIFSREELAHLAWGYTHVNGSRFIDMEVSRLRAKLNIGDAAPQIVAVRRRGYRLLLDAVDAALDAVDAAPAAEADETAVA